VFSYGSAFKVMITAQRISGALSAEEAESWLAWYDFLRTIVPNR
jgi:hypothetical protein